MLDYILFLRKVDWQVDFASRHPLSRKQNQAKLSALGFSLLPCLSPCCIIPSSSLKSSAFMFCILFASVNMQMNITEH